MAGIGFELKRLFARKGFLATLRAYGYAGVVCTGPMILGVILLLGIMLLANFGGEGRADRELLLSMITYALLASLTVTSFFTMLTTRYSADMMYMDKNSTVMPSFYGSISIMLTVGGIGYGTFLFFAGIPLSYQVLSLLLFLTLIVVWTETTYLSAVKDYKNILLAFVFSLILTFTMGFLLLWLTDMHMVNALMLSVICGYSVMAIWYFRLLYKYFPEGFGSSMSFLVWVDKYPHLSLVGAFITFGLFGHLLIMWSSPLGVQIQGLFYGAPEHDVAALIAFFSLLVTTVNFVTSVEVRFYPQYRNYFSLFNDNGSIGDIETAEVNMIRVLRDELSYLGQKQMFTTVFCIVIGTILLPNIGLGFTSRMLGMFRVLCVGYALYAIGNSIMLIMLYFSDNKGALYVSAAFAVTTNVMSWVLKSGSSAYYGFGFAIGSAVFCIAAYFRLSHYISKLKYHVLSEQPLFDTESRGLLTKMCIRLEKRAVKKQRKRKEYYEKL